MNSFVASNKASALKTIRTMLGFTDDYVFPTKSVKADMDDLTEHELSLGLLHLRVYNLDKTRGSLAVKYKRQSLSVIFADIVDISVSLEDLNGRYDNQALANALVEKYGLDGKLLVKYTTSDVRLLPTVVLTAHPVCEDYFGSVTVTVKEK
jgi:hypothetical protein